MFGRPYILLTCAMLALFPCAGPASYAQDNRGIGGVASGVSGGSEQKAALVIGNAAYKTDRLRNPVNDATDIAAVLTKCGFTVMLKTDCDLRAMKAALDDFGKQIQNGGIALFFYAGHGLQVEGRNYLMPLGAAPQGPSDVEFECLDAGRVLAKLEDAPTRLNIIILDACRNNPLARSWNRAFTPGLAAMEAPTGSIMAFATAAGSTADDGPDRNGLYTGKLLPYLQAPGLSVLDVFRKAALDVQQASGKKQVPWLSLSFMGDFYFLPGVAPEATTVASVPTVAPPAPVAPSLVGHLQVAVNAPEAKVIIDGKPAGKAKLNEALNISNLPVGKTPVRVEAEGYEPLEKVVDIPENDWAQEKFVLAKVIVVKPEETRPPVVITPSTPPTETSSDGSKAGQTKTVDLGGGVSMELVWIPPGTFRMGSPESEAERASDEGPQHEVTISRGFWLGKYEVTQGQWVAVMGSNPSDFKGDTNLPVEQVSWDDCQSFIQKLNSRSGAGFRLPTEAEWEYACRAGTSTPFSFGETISTDQANYDGSYTYGNGRKGTYRQKTTPVGSFPANAWGLHDMHGNVWEWCSDWYDSGYYVNSPRTDPTGPSSGSNRVDRGGGWFYDPGLCRSAGRKRDSPGSRSFNLGFRLAASAVQ